MGVTMTGVAPLALMALAHAMRPALYLMAASGSVAFSFMSLWPNWTMKTSPGLMSERIFSKRPRALLAATVSPDSAWLATAMVGLKKMGSIWPHDAQGSPI